MLFEEIFQVVFEKNGLSQYATGQNTEKFKQLSEIMLATNQNMNITAITDVEKVIPLHFADCVKVADLIPENARVLDVGCGGGYPVLPLAIVRPDLEITGLDSTDKKIKYVQNTADQLGLNVRTISARAEDAAKLPEYREKYDVVISRAVARLNVLDELCLPFVKIGGLFIAMKGAAGEEELHEAKNGIQKLGGNLSDISKYDLHLLDTTEQRSLIVAEKVACTPKEFPRSFGSIKKKPL